jgi:hypothetical protein
MKQEEELDPKLWGTLNSTALKMSAYRGDYKYCSHYPGGLTYKILSHSTEYATLWLVCKQTRKHLLVEKTRLYSWFTTVTIRGVAKEPDHSSKTSSAKIADFTKQLYKEAERISIKMKACNHVLLCEYSWYTLVSLGTFVLMYVFALGHDAGKKQNTSV